MADLLTLDTLLTTTRSVRKRLDFSKAVPRQMIEECIVAAQQAPSGGNLQTWGFVVVTEPQKRTALADLYRKGYETFLSTPIAEAMGYGNPHASAEQQRILSSIAYLVDHLAQVPVLVIPCISPRLEGLPLVLQHAVSGSILPATWNFMLAARARGLGTCWTIFHLYFEEEAAKLLGIPHADVAQVALIPVAYTLGADFKPGPRQPLASMIHWDAW
jgi:nitroreductase